MASLQEAPRGSRWRRLGAPSDLGRIIARYIDTPAGRPREPRVVMFALSTAPNTAFAGGKLDLPEADLVEGWERLDPPPRAPLEEEPDVE